MNLTPDQKRIIESVVNVFETGSVHGNYGDITVLPDGPGDRRQITYGRSQTTEWGHLKELLRRYCDAPEADKELVKHVLKFLPSVGSSSLVNSMEFRGLLSLAGKTDPVMRYVQDQFFDDVYFQPAMRWCDANGFELPLSALVVYDSFIHSGGIHWFLRNRFAETPPAKGGSEKDWIRAYVNTRDLWLRHHSRQILHVTVYRTQCLGNEIVRGNWNLDKLPILAHGVKVS